MYVVVLLLTLIVGTGKNIIPAYVLDCQGIYLIYVNIGLAKCLFTAQSLLVINAL